MGRTKTYYTKDILKLELAQQLGYGEKIKQYYTDRTGKKTKCNR